MDFKLAELFSLSFLEKDRISAPKSDLRNIGAFASLEDVIEKSFQPKEKILVQKVQTMNSALVSGVPIKTPAAIKRPFHDDALMEKLLKYRDQIPISGRIIRASES